ncbi:hypothetical protein [Gloeothece verrucosa]|uniref:Uncharacterized protein n=1 Tax=Gloeothece verrucosa (strain PCC 7822) TaxID=497965 RepID=E0UGS8_GLOV7|nr:hypothetical protein [Gloeothece verrucosa]ADN14409.1 conserved hypothetical protein [Gloeothece verrucosa PCC 7822]
MTEKTLNFNSLQMLLSLVLPAGCQTACVSNSTYRINCPNYKIACQVWEKFRLCVEPLLEEGAVVEVIAYDFYARSNPKFRA